MAGDDSPMEAPRPRRKIEPRTAGLVIGVVALLAFVLDNRDEVSVGFVFFDVKAPLIWVLLGTAVVGAVLGSLIRRRRRRGDDD